MRFSQSEQTAICETVREFDSFARVFVFGSRIDEMAKGGDIDLFILSKRLPLLQQIRLKLRLYDRLGEQKIDLIVTPEPQTVFNKLP